MQFQIITVLGLAIMAAALPTDQEVKRTTPIPTTVSQCNANSNTQVACCNSGGGILDLLNLLTCTIPIAGGNCSPSTKVNCCKTSANQVGVININALNCSPIL